jgi:hypothetical protein
VKVSLSCDQGHRNVKARLSDDPCPEPPMPGLDSVWTIPTEDGVIIVPEKLLAWDAAKRAAAVRGDRDG